MLFRFKFNIVDWSVYLVSIYFDTNWYVFKSVFINKLPGNDNKKSFYSN